MEIQIRKATIQDIDLLMLWRMEVLHDVFSIPPGQSVTDLEKENRRYYQTELLQGRHIACFAYMGEEIAGCGGMCLYHEMPSPDNPNGKCAYLMNIYSRPQFRRQGIGHAIVCWLIGQAHLRGISKIYLETSQDGRPLYQEIGFSDMIGYMKLTEKKTDRNEIKGHPALQEAYEAGKNV